MEYFLVKRVLDSRVLAARPRPWQATATAARKTARRLALSIVRSLRLFVFCVRLFYRTLNEKKELEIVFFTKTMISRSKYMIVLRYELRLRPRPLQEGVPAGSPLLRRGVLLPPLPRRGPRGGPEEPAQAAESRRSCGCYTPTCGRNYVCPLCCKSMSDARRVLGDAGGGPTRPSTCGSSARRAGLTTRGGRDDRHVKDPRPAAGRRASWT